MSSLAHRVVQQSSKTKCQSCNLTFGQQACPFFSCGNLPLFSEIQSWTMGVRAGERGLHQLGRRGPARGVSKNQVCHIHRFAKVLKLQWQRRDGRLPGQGYGKVVDAGGDGQAEAHLRKVYRRWVGEPVNDTFPKNSTELTVVQR